MDFKSNQDLYDFVRSIVSIANDLGDFQTAKELSDSMNAFPISSQFGGLHEALMEFGKRLEQKEYPYPVGLKKDVTDSLNEIEKAFRRANSPFYNLWDGIVSKVLSLLRAF